MRWSTRRSLSPLTVSAFSGRRPSRAGDLTIETHGIAPIGEDQRYGTPARLFTVWFAPQVNVTGVFSGALAIVLGLGFWLGLLAMVIGTVLGAFLVAYLSTWGPRTGAGQLPNSRMAFGGGVVLPAVLQWLSSIAWDALVGLFGGEALAALLGIPFWIAVLIVLGAQGLVGFFGYELIHRLQAVLTLVLFTTFVVFAVKLVGGHEIVTPTMVSGADLAGAFVLEMTIAFSLAVSWASYAADFSRYLPATSSPARVFGFTFAGIVLAYFFIQGIGIAAGNVVAEHTAEGVRSVMGGGLLGGLALLVIALASIGSGVMCRRPRRHDRHRDLLHPQRCHGSSLRSLPILLSPVARHCCRWPRVREAVRARGAGKPARDPATVRPKRPRCAAAMLASLPVIAN